MKDGEGNCTLEALDHRASVDVKKSHHPGDDNAKQD